MFVIGRLLKPAWSAKNGTVSTAAQVDMRAETDAVDVLPNTPDGHSHIFKDSLHTAAEPRTGSLLMVEPKLFVAGRCNCCALNRGRLGKKLM